MSAWKMIAESMNGNVDTHFLIIVSSVFQTVEQPEVINQFVYHGEQ